MTRPASALTIAGSDSGGGAGIQADLKTFSALQVYGTSAITAITAQNTRGVLGVEAITPAMVAAQIAAVLDDIPPAAIKIGMLATAEITRAVSEALGGYDGPVVLDPVMVAKSGDALLAADAEAALVELIEGTEEAPYFFTKADLVRRAARRRRAGRLSRHAGCSA